MNSHLMKSSHAFLVPTVVGLFTNHSLYSLACFNLYLSSQAYHRTHHVASLLWDQSAIFSTWFLGVYYNLQVDLLYSSQYWLITLYLWFIFYYGYLVKDYCFGPKRDQWHATIHYSSALGIVLTQIFTQDRML